MPNQRRRRARAGLIGGVSVLAAVACMSLTGLVTASASNLPPGNTVIIGSGSQTAYSLMTGLDDLFNSSQGCNEIAAAGTSEVQSLSFNCAAGPAGAVGLPAANGENPLNDVALQEPPLGGSNGLKQLEGQVPVLGTEPISFATTVRNPTASDPQGLNFVNYADDAISWFHFTKVGKKATPSAKIKSLTILQLENIWLGNITNWKSLGGKSAPIKVYVTNSGSSLLTIWNTSLGNINSQTYPETEGPSYVIEQNEDASIIKNGNEADAIFFFSRGRFLQTCDEGTCGGSRIPGGGTTALGEINGVKLTNANILSGLWPVRVFLSNVYSDGSNSKIPAANQATLNYVSEDGFLCKSQTSHGKRILDPLTGVWYRTEIDNLIAADGFVPIPIGSEGLVTNPAVPGSPYSGYDSSGSDPRGYCKVSTTDGNA
ncbi:MAG: substrate-binding domain-containing protein [Acidimicrobiales bacterium]